MVDPAADPVALRLCRSLGGFDDVSARFAKAATDDLVRRFGTDLVDSLVAKYDAEGVHAVVTEKKWQPHIRALLIFLYTGFGADQARTDTPENHYESLMWRAALAHPPALSGGYFGHWSYPPDEVNA